MTSTIPERLWTIRETAEFLGVAVVTVRRMIANGSLKARKIGSAVRIDPRDAARAGVPIKTYRASTVAGEELD